RRRAVLPWAAGVRKRARIGGRVARRRGCRMPVRARRESQGRTGAAPSVQDGQNPEPRDNSAIHHAFARCLTPADAGDTRARSTHRNVDTTRRGLTPLRSAVAVILWARLLLRFRASEGDPRMNSRTTVLALASIALVACGGAQSTD